jgi:hypothetical protein
MFQMQRFSAAASGYNLSHVIMSSDTGASILDEALACIGQRIALILVHPADKDENYIASLRNEVVGIC